MPGTDVTARSIVRLALLVFASSFIGLNGVVWTDGDLARDLNVPFGFMADVWTESVLADLLFVAGIVAIAVSGHRAAGGGHPLLAAIAGVGGALLVYTVSYYAVDGFRDLGDAMETVVHYGWVGILFTGVAPAATACWDAHIAATAPGAVKPPR